MKSEMVLVWVRGHSLGGGRIYLALVPRSSVSIALSRYNKGVIGLKRLP